MLLNLISLGVRASNYTRMILNSRVGPDIFFACIPDIRLIFNAGYPVSGQISGQRRIHGKLNDIWPDNRIVLISSIRQDIENGRISDPTLLNSDVLLKV